MTDEEEMVLNYINLEDCSPLMFVNREGEHSSPSIYYVNLDLMVYDCLDLAYDHYSINIRKITETHPDKWRSVLDIWRHVIFFNPKIDIFSVMRSLYRQQSKLVGHYCGNIHRRVFKLEKNASDCLLFTQDRDEFGLHFDDWKNIGEKNGHTSTKI